MRKKIAAILITLLLPCLCKFSSSPIFAEGSGYYGVTTGKGSAGKTEYFETTEMYKFYGYVLVCGQSLTTDDKTYIDDFLAANACVEVKEEHVENITIKYYYSPKMWGYKTVNGKKVNVQTAEIKGKYTIGTPLIYGGY